MDTSILLAQRHLTLVARHADYELSRLRDIIEHKVLVDGRAGIEELFGQLLACDGEPSPKTLDLVGHSTPGKSLLTLGDWVIDTASTTVTAFFHELAQQDVLPRLGITAVRLLGCQTADTRHARATICALSDILEVDVYGTTSLIYSAHYDADGFRDDCRHLLACSTDLRQELSAGSSGPEPSRFPQTLDLDALPSAPLIVRENPWPRRIATIDATRRILRLVRRNAGAQMPGLLSAPSCEVAMPAAKSNWYHLAQILMDGEFVRVYPDGNRKPGVLYPVDDSHAMKALVEELPTSM